MLPGTCNDNGNAVPPQVSACICDVKYVEHKVARWKLRVDVLTANYSTPKSHNRCRTKTFSFEAQLDSIIGENLLVYQ